MMCSAECSSLVLFSRSAARAGVAVDGLGVVVRVGASGHHGLVAVPLIH